MIAQLMRIPGFRRLWKRFPLGSVKLRTEFDIWERPNYAYGIYWAAFMARALAIKEIGVVEFGVAGGNGLVNLETIAEAMEAFFGLKIKVYGFDSGEGMPAPVDYRDLPHVWREGYWKMDRAALEPRLRRAELIIGDVAETVPRFLERQDIPPIAFISFDLDYYSSTVKAFGLLGASRSKTLPRVYCYFDDIIWPAWACHSEHVGELLAIREFNAAHDKRKIEPVNGLRWMRLYPDTWNDMIYVFHDFTHPDYTRLVTPDERRQRELPLAAHTPR